MPDGFGSRADHGEQPGTCGDHDQLGAVARPVAMRGALAPGAQHAGAQRPPRNSSPA